MHRFLAERGPTAFRIEDVTQLADVGFGTFYGYLDSKEALTAALAAIRGVASGRISADADTAGATMMLSGLGVDHDEARTSANTPLPEVM